MRMPGIILYHLLLIIISYLLNCSKGTTIRKVLVVRVIAADVSTTASSTKLSEQIFGTTFSASSQYKACSFDELLFSPFIGATLNGEVISDGIGQVTITDNVEGNSAAVIRNAIETAAVDKYGDLEQFDNVLLCLPPGSYIGGSSEWIGYAFYDHYLSVFNDLYCTYPSALMHEIGHNLGLAHSDVDYEDKSCIMGYSYEEENGPRMCFNGAKSWQLDWYSDGHMSIDASGLAEWEYYEIDIIGIANFDDRSDEKVIIQITGTTDDNDYYIAFNRKNGINSGTRENGDKVLITSRIAGQSSTDSTLEVSLGTNELYFIHNVDSTSHIMIRVESIDLDGSPAYAKLYVAKYHDMCYSDNYCNDYDSCTIDKCDKNLVRPGFPVDAGTCVYEPLPCNDCGSGISFKITTNDYPEKITWSIINVDKNIAVLSGGPYSEPDTLYEVEKCVELGNYIFNLTDSLDDGVCCSPNYTVSIQGKIMQSSTASLSFRHLEARSVEKVFLYNEGSNNKIFDIVCTEQDCVDYDACTADVFDPDTRLCTFEPLATCGDGTNFTVTIVTDDYPEETAWNVIHNESKRVVMSGGPYPSFSRKKKSGKRRILNSDSSLTYSEEKILDNGTYRLIIQDDFGDGLCCDEGNGGYTTTINDVEISSGGEFGYFQQDTYDFNECDDEKTFCDDSDDCTEDKCIANTCIYKLLPCNKCGKVEVSIHLYTDLFPLDISWTITSLLPNTVMSGDGYSEVEHLYIENGCLSPGTYTFDISDARAVGLCCESGKGYYSVFVGVDKKVHGGVFNSFEEHIFDTYSSSTPPSTSKSPTKLLTGSPTPSLTSAPTLKPTSSPTNAPTLNPTIPPTLKPTMNPTPIPTLVPTGPPTTSPTVSPTNLPTTPPTGSPTNSPTTSPTDFPTRLPTDSPTRLPTDSPTNSPTDSPTNSPTDSPTNSPTDSPTNSPTTSLASSPSTSSAPSALAASPPKVVLYMLPSRRLNDLDLCPNLPTPKPTRNPTIHHSHGPTIQPILKPTRNAKKKKKKNKKNKKNKKKKKGKKNKKKKRKEKKENKSPMKSQRPILSLVP